MTTHTDVKELVQQKYGAGAERVTQGQASSCCGGASAAISGCDPITANLAVPLTCAYYILCP